jgi:CheY-like chemotaxis protein
MENIRKSTLEMHTLLLCADVQFLGITRNVLNQLHVTPKIVGGAEGALAMIQEQEFDVIVVDWREIDNLADFLCAVRRSKLNRECVLVAIVRDLLDLRQAFAAGVQLLIHKPASAVQIERCLRAAYCARVAQRRKQHRELVNIVASIRTRAWPLAEAVIFNLSEGGVGMRTEDHLSLSAGEELDLRFALPESDEMVDIAGVVVWRTAGACGVRFGHIPEGQREALQLWLTACVERSLARMCECVRAACA